MISLPGRSGLRASLWIIAAVLVIRFIWFVALETSQRSIGLAGYLAPARMLLDGESPLFFYDDARYNAYVARFEPDIHQTFFVNPPSIALLFMPLAWLPYTPARVLWTVANGFAYLIMLWWLARQLRFSSSWLPLFVIAGLLYHPIYESIQLGQVYILLLGLELLVWYGYRQGKEGLAGIALGIMLIFKLAGLLLWPLLLIQKRWRVMVWGSGTAVCIALLSLPWLGTAVWQHHIVLLFQSRTLPVLRATAYQTWNSLSTRPFIPDAQWNPSPLFNYPAAGGFLHGLGLFVLLLVTLFAAFRVTHGSVAIRGTRAANDLLFALFMIVDLIINPATLDYHYPLLILPLAILAAHARGEGNDLLWLGLLVAFVLIALDLPYRSPRLTDGAWILLAYPKLYGTLLLWVMTLWQLRLRNAR